jgi:NADPH-dependent glutamate synthase beta subunit-like oxidoreductase
VTDSHDSRRDTIDRTATEVRLSVSATDDFAPGVKGFFQRWASAWTGLVITGKRSLTPPKTLRYPAEKLTLSPRWRGPLRLTGILGRDDIPTIEALPPEYNALVESLYKADTLPPCAGNCPANVDARGQAYHLADGRVGEAYELVRDRNTLPGVLGRICHHPCETACRRNYYDEPIAIRPLHRVAFERYAEVRKERVKPLPRTRDQEIAIIGSGPSGLTVAYDLMRMGYGVTVYEKDHHPGGALYSGVPAYRLPREVLMQEIDDLIAMGMHLRLNVSVGEDVPIDHLLGEYDSVLIAAGLQESRILPLPGHESHGVVGALDFLRAGNWKNDAGVKGKRVVVVGGGNVAVDCARVALRVGASEVTLTSLESMDELPAHPWEIEEALDEGVTANCSWGPNEVVAENGQVTGLKLQSCLSVFDAQGRFSPKFAEEFVVLPADVIVFAIGQAPKLGPIVAGSDLLLTDRGLLPVDGSLLTTSVPGVFACGEVVTGPGSAIASIASGHEAATSIHRYLQGESLSEGRSYRPVPVYPHYDTSSLEGVESSRRRAKMPMAKGTQRAKDFRTVELGFTHLEGLAEAARCLRCSSGVCVGCTFCARTCPDYCIRVERVDDPEGRCVTRYDFDMSKCCFCGLCAEQCPTHALKHTGQFELSFYSREYTLFDKDEMLRTGLSTRATGVEMPVGAASGRPCVDAPVTPDSTPGNPEDAPLTGEVLR